MPSLIVSLKNLINSDTFRNHHKIHPKDFTRKRALPFESLIQFFINLPQAAYVAELSLFNKSSKSLDIAEPLATKSALTKARAKLKFGAFIEINDHLVGFHENHFGPKLWRGFRLLATDGSMATLPTSGPIAEHFGQWKGPNGEPCSKARISEMYDVLNQITIDALLKPKVQGERELAATHYLKLMPDDLILLDRGYEGFWTFKLIVSRGADFCGRVSLKKMKVVRKFICSGELERTVTLPSTYYSARKCAELGIDSEPFKIRLIRVTLSTGETEVLATSLLDRKKYPAKIFADLYHLRWPVEEDYKILKSRIQIERFSGKTVHSVYQDFHAKVFSKNLTAILIGSVEDKVHKICQGRKYDYKVNFTNALAAMRHHVVVLFNRCEDQLSEAVAKIQALVIQALCEIRKGRNQPRNFKKSSRKKFHTAYKPYS